MKYYAVARGHQVGIFYDEWKNVKPFINGYSNAKYKGFKTQAAAETWFNQYVNQGNNTNVPSSSSRISNNTNKINKSKNSTKTEENERDKIIIYTDGSHTNNYGGWGYVVLYNGEVIDDNYGAVVSYPATNNQGELNAIYSALANYPDVSVIYSDSEYSIKIFTEWIEGWKKRGWKKSNGGVVRNQPLIKLIDQLIQVRSTPLLFKHVRAHQGHIHNEMADKLAKLGRPDTLADMYITNINLNNLEENTRLVIQDSVKSIYYDDNEMLMYVINNVDSSNNLYHANTSFKMNKRGISPPLVSVINVENGSQRKQNGYVYKVERIQEIEPVTYDTYINLERDGQSIWSDEMMQYMISQRQLLVDTLYNSGYYSNNLDDTDFVIIGGRLYLVNYNNMYFWPSASA